MSGIEELIKEKKANYEMRKVSGASASLLKVLGDEIEELANTKDDPRVEQAFLDECAG